MTVLSHCSSKLSCLLLLIFFAPNVVVAFVPVVKTASSSSSNTLAYATPQKKQTSVLGDEEAPAGIGGAEFFGGNKQKEEFFDPVAEEQAGSIMEVETETMYDRFTSESFEEGVCTAVAKSLQSQLNAALYEGAAAANKEYTYASSFQWTTPLKTSTANPMLEVATALDFYNNVDIAIVGGRTTSDENVIQLEWELSLVWPTFWAPRILLLGTSDLRLDGNTIVQQTDTLLKEDMLDTIGSQIKPRFWDWYHIGMTPSAEQMPKLNLQKPGLFSTYQVYEIPSRLALVPTVLDSGIREERNAQTIPNHAFSCIIKTMGPTRQRYVPTSPIEVQLIPGGERLQLKWNIPLAVEFQTNAELPLPGSDPEADPDSSPMCTYERQPRRKVATVPYGGNPQDDGISEIRKNLYEKVIKDGLKPKLDDNGRPMFFFLDHKTKACYTEEGLGMAVYEWRLESAKSNEVGIELEYS